MPRPSAEAPPAEAPPAEASPRRRWLRLLAVLYLALLATSHLVRWWTADDAELPPGAREMELPAFVGDREVEGEKVRLAYYEWDDGTPRPQAAPPVVLLLHGSPGRGGSFARLAPLLAERFRVLGPDLPGFASSERRIPDYSIRAHARYVEAFLDELGIDEVHVVGFSMGGGVALEMAARQPERLRSLTLLSSIGVQELELLGSYHLNHAVHGLQLGALWLLRETVPHFGVFDVGAVAYARNFYDTDQRPLEGILKTLEMPVLIVHGEDDVLVGVEAAYEHHRLVPQSELELFDASHFMVFLQPEELAEALAAFVERVERGEGRRRAAADPERVAAAAAERVALPEIHGFGLVVWMALAAAATLVSEDLTCIGAGLLIAKGRVAFFPAALACFLGIFLGDLMLYFAGRLGRGWLGRAPLRWIVRPADVERSRAWFERRGGLVIFLSRFLPGTRLPTYVTAGLLRMNAFWFTLQLLVPVALWTPLLVGAAQLLGEQAFASLDLFERYALPGFVGLLLGVWTVLTLGRSLATHRGRRLLRGWWRRKVEWKLWPVWLFYLPVVARVLGLGIRYRGLTLFTAANPGIPAGGGFIGESKAEILSRLDPRWVATFRPVPGELALAERLAAVRAFRKRNGFGFPVVLKVDQGQRGAGVRIARSEEDVVHFFRTTPQDAIVQEYVPGPELGVFYVRLPGEEQGRIFSVTDKRLPSVVGDARSTLEELVLDDERAVAMAPVYLKALGERSAEVPAAGEEVRLTELGTHCRGAVFLDGARFATPRLTEAVERISRSFDGFYFGRYDLKAPSYEAFEAGRDLKVLELNGVTSEATHVYDPQVRLVDAYRVLFEQWRLAFEAGARNRDRGVEPVGLLELLRMLVAFRML